MVLHSWGNLQVRKFQVHAFNEENNLSYSMKNDKKCSFLNLTLNLVQSCACLLRDNAGNVKLWIYPLNTQVQF